MFDGATPVKGQCHLSTAVAGQAPRSARSEASVNSKTSWTKEAPSGGISEQRCISQNASSMPSPSRNSRGFRYFLSDFDWQMLW